MEPTSIRQAKIKAALNLPTELLAGKMVGTFRAELETLRRTPKLDREQFKMFQRLKAVIKLVE